MLWIRIHFSGSGCGSGFIISSETGYGYGSGSRSRVLMTKNWKNYSGKNSSFLIKREHWAIFALLDPDPVRIHNTAHRRWPITSLSRWDSPSPVSGSWEFYAIYIITTTYLEVAHYICIQIFMARPYTLCYWSKANVMHSRILLLVLSAAMFLQSLKISFRVCVFSPWARAG